MKKALFLALCLVCFGTVAAEPLKGEFSVSRKVKVAFAPGNLQYCRESNTWKFAGEQYEYKGKKNVVAEQVAESAAAKSSRKARKEAVKYSFADTIDCFAFSGEKGVEYGVSLGNDKHAFKGRFVDWGKTVSDSVVTWRTLSKREWKYLLKKRKGAESRLGVAKIMLSDDTTAYVNGLVLLPDNWTCPQGLAFRPGMASGRSIHAYGMYNTYTIAQWKEMERAGAVFLPASGFRWGAMVEVDGVMGYYWSRSRYSVGKAYYMYFYANELIEKKPYARSSGLAVRLVSDVK